MFGTNCLEVNKEGALTIGGLDVSELVRKFGTPLYVLDEAEIRRRCQLYARTMERAMSGNGTVAYASKAFCCKGMCRIIMEEGLSLDVVSGSELYTAMSIGFPVDRILFHGNNKTRDELLYAVQGGVGTIVVDNWNEMELLAAIAQDTGNRVRVQLRLKPGVEAHTHEFIRTGGIDSKFGFAVETGEAYEAVERITALDGLVLAGFHCHIGSQILDTEPYHVAARVLLELAARVKSELGVTVQELNMGGGFGIRYGEEDEVPGIESVVRGLVDVVWDTCRELEIPRPKLIIEPGRSIVGPAGITLYRVGGIKEIPDIRTYVSVDGGMADNPRHALYGAEYEMLIANRADQPKERTVTVAGRCCESGDLLGKDVRLQEVEIGDILVVLATGAYNYAMASHYNRLPKPAVVVVKGGEAKVMIRRETYEDVLRGDV